MIVMHPVLEVYSLRGFDLWPVGAPTDGGFLHLHAGLSPTAVGTAVMRIASCNDIELLPEGHPPRPQAPVDGFLHGLLTLDELFVAGGLRITDTVSGATLLPGCCCGLGEWRDWLGHVNDDRRWLDLGHDPWPLVESSGDGVRITVDTETEGSPVIEVSTDELRALLRGAEDDLTGFLRSARVWAGDRLPDHAGPLDAALARSLDVAVPLDE